ncbi:MAG: helix-turn-helix domain-containing protein [Methanosarcinales archaeon]|nr:helix-turn-helix domain-containing protein [Methanosarcinales archaeon]
MIDSIAIGNEIKRRRENKGFNEQQIADFLEVDVEYIIQREAGKEPFSAMSLENVCNLLGCDIMDILDENHESDPLKISFRSSNFETEDLIAISKINKIALNLNQMNQWLKENEE